VALPAVLLEKPTRLWPWRQAGRAELPDTYRILIWVVPGSLLLTGPGEMRMQEKPQGMRQTHVWDELTVGIFVRWEKVERGLQTV
jgi:hypothetical protein